MKFLLDVSALISLGVIEHEFHDRTARWVKDLANRGAPQLATCAITELGFMRVLAQAPQYGFGISQARDLLLRCKSTGNLLFLAERETIGFDPR